MEIEDTSPTNFDSTIQSSEIDNDDINDAPLTVPSDFQVLQAAVFLYDAVTDNNQVHKIDRGSLFRYRIFCHPLYSVLLITLNLVQLFFIPIIQYPAVYWAQEVPSWVSFAIELFCLVIYVLNFVFMTTFTPIKEILKNPMDWCYLSFLFLSLLENIMVFSLHQSKHRIMVSILFRPFYLIYHSNNLRWAVEKILRVIPAISLYIFALLYITLIYAIVGRVTFYYDDENKVFDSLFDAFIQLYVYFTTCNSPDVYMPAYSQASWTVLFFISYSVITYLLLLPILLAAVYSKYKALLNEEFIRLVCLEKTLLAKAFVSLDPASNGKIPYSTFSRLLRCHDPSLSERKIEMLCNMTDTFQTGTIEPCEFMYLVDVLQINVSTNDPSEKSKNLLSVSKRWISSTFFCRAGNTILGSKLFELFICVLILVDVFLIVFEERRTTPLFCGTSAATHEIVFSSIFAAELILRFIFNGWSKFVANIFNLFDAAIIMASLSGYMLTHIDYQLCNMEIVRLLFFAPVLRLFRLLILSGFFNRVLDALKDVLPSMLIYAFIEAMIMYFLSAAVGMIIWAGKISPDNPAIQQTGYGQANYWPNNFDNLFRAYVTVFELRVVNNWQVIASGFVAVSGKIGWLYFIVGNIADLVLAK